MDWEGLIVENAVEKGKTKSYLQELFIRCIGILVVTWSSYDLSDRKLICSALVVKSWIKRHFLRFYGT